jgi:glycyl-tRNA synthetase beta subunit
MGPPVSAAFDAEGIRRPPGWGLRASSVRISMRSCRPTRRAASTHVSPPDSRARDRRRAARILAVLLRDLTFPKQMHWDAELTDEGRAALRSSLPIRWLLFLYGGRVVPFTIARQATASSPRVRM